MRRQGIRIELSTIALGCIALLSGCGGGGDSAGGGMAQSISFNFPGGPTVAVPPDVATTKLVATASGGGAVTYTSNTPDTCTVSGDTLSLLKAGECSVTASQAGGNGYAPASTTQLFVIPKRPQVITFRNPGAQPLDATPVSLVATSSIPGNTVTFSSTTPSVCTVSGTSMIKVDNGLCVIKAEAGNDVFAPGTVSRTIPIGTEKAPALTFLSGFKNPSNTNEGGGIGTFSGSSADSYWCATDWCAKSASADGKSFTYEYNIRPQPKDISNGLGGYLGFNIMAGPFGLDDKSNTTKGVRIDAQEAIHLTLAQNQEWFSTGKNSVNIDLALGHFALKEGKYACNVTLRAVLQPTAAVATTYSIRLKDQFTFLETCGLTGLDLWNEIQDYPIARVEIRTDNVNTTVSSTGNDTPTFPTRLTLTAPVVFQ